jgi:hypothetical protein
MIGALRMNKGRICVWAKTKPHFSDEYTRSNVDPQDKRLRLSPVWMSKSAVNTVVHIAGRFHVAIGESGSF